MNNFNKKLIFNKIISDTFKLFLTLIFSFGLIVWVIQAVNFLDFVTEDGHGLDIYFKYTILSLPKIISELIPLIYFISLFYIITNYEENNELKILWFIGIEKKELIKQILKFSLIIMFVFLFLKIMIVPFTQKEARKFIQTSNIDYFPSLIQEKKFIDTVKGLTIYVDEKNQNNFKNIFLEEKKKDSKQIIFAKEGRLILDKNEKKFILNNGRVININQNNLNEFDFKTTTLNLENYITKSVTDFKIQEKSTVSLFSCFWNFHVLKKIIEFYDPNNCNNEAIKSIASELHKRIVKPMYILIISLITSLVIMVPKENYLYKKSKIAIFFTSFLIIVLSEILVSLINLNYIILIFINTLPILLFLIVYTINQKLKINI